MADPQDVSSSQKAIAKDKEMNDIVDKALARGRKKRKSKGGIKPLKPLEKLGLDPGMANALMGSPAYEDGWIYLQSVQFSGQSRTDIFNDKIRAFIDARLQKIFHVIHSDNNFILIQANPERFIVKFDYFLN